jgi:alanine dehydrogenase
MIIGIPKEIKVHEYRVGATPAMVRVLAENGHQIRVQSNAGAKIGFTDDDYEMAGALIVASLQEVYQSDMIIKVKEPQKEEFPCMHDGQILFCYLHLAPDPEQAKHLIEKKVVAIAYETVVDFNGNLPLLIPMSEIAGRISIQVGAIALQMNEGGKGILLGGVPGVAPAKVVIIGGGASGTEAARLAMGMGAQVVVIDKDIQRLRYLDALFAPRLQTLYSTPTDIENAIAKADLVIGAVLVPGKLTPKLITRNMIKKMEPGSVLVDISIDQGGCAETSRPTTHTDPTYVVDGIVHYCVTNMPGACARTATLALTHVTMDYALQIANKGYIKALKDNIGLRQGLNVCKGVITNANVASDLGYPYISPEEVLNT